MRTQGLARAMENLRMRYRGAARDPVRFLRRYDRAEDKEIAGFLAAALAFGNVRSFERTIDGILARMGPSPSRYLKKFSAARHGKHFRGIGHRWIRDTDIVHALTILHRVLAAHGSLKALFLVRHTEADADTGRALAAFIAECRRLARDIPPGRWRFLFPSPADGSACKRLNLFLRWMVRDADGRDEGVWPEVGAARLVVPLDTHIHRLGTYLGLTKRKSKDWATAAEITGALRSLSPGDPLVYDYALCHHGMEYCSGRDPRTCPACPLEAYCRPPDRVRPRAGAPARRASRSRSSARG